MSQLRAKRITSIASLKSELKKSSNSASYLKRIAEGEMNVRFLTEPDGSDDKGGWIKYSEHYDAVHKFFPCVTEDCPGCLEKMNASDRYLVNALDRDEDQVVPLVLPKSLVDILMRRYDKFKTLMDRDYLLEREGSAKNDTSYDAVPEAPTRLNIKKYELIDLYALLESQRDSFEDEDEDDDDDDNLAAPVKASVKKRRAAPVVDDDDEDEEDDEDDADETVTEAVVEADDDDEDDDFVATDEEADSLERDRLEALTLREVRAKAKERGIGADDLKGLSKVEIVDILLKEAAIDADAEDDEEELTEEDLEEMSLAELKKLCKTMDVAVPKGADKETLIDLLLDQAE